MHRHNSPCALHHELHCESADNKKREARWKNPERNQDYAEYRSQNNRPTASPFLRQMTDHCSATDCTNSVNDPIRGPPRHTILAMLTKKSLIHVLGPMRQGVECRHQ